MSQKSQKLYPIIGTGIYILNDKAELLLMKRISPNGPGTWSPAGGHLEFGEAFDDCVRREAKEEWGIDVGNIRLLGLTNDIYQANKHSVTLHFACSITKGEPTITEPHNFTEIGWFKLNNLPSPLFHPVANFLQTEFDCFCGSGKKYKKCHRIAT
ncbi:MAG: NUDIX domain-containing protein [bacterium]|nr:NUDIX domain-containing protein [bacterium]